MTRLIHMLALIGLLVQGTIGVVAPMGGVCFSASHLTCHTSAHDASESHVACCATEAAMDRPHTMLSPPCDDGCPSCVDLQLLDDAAWCSARAGVIDALDAAVFAVVPACVMSGVIEPSLHVHPQGTGPPGLRACPHALQVKTTRLLL